MKKIVSILLVVLLQFVCLPPQKVSAATTVDLLTATSFAVLAGQHITNVPTSTITGNVGLSPAAGSFITGLTSAEVTGTIYAVDGTGPGGSVSNAGLLTQAKNDLTTAYLDADGRTPATVLSGSDNQLGGQTLTPGIYSFGAASTANLIGTVTLNGQGDANAVFIFQASSSLVTNSASVVALTGGTLPCNVFWQVDSSAILGTGSQFKGNILALTDITDNGGSTVLGRLLARNNDVILNNTTITSSACAGSSSSSASSSSGGSSPTSLSCPAFNYQTPIILESRRVDSDSIFLSWGPYSGTDLFNVRYGVANGEWLYSTDVTGFSTTINALPANVPIWFQVAARNSCAIGTYGTATLVGSPLGSTLIPRLPNTGFEASDQNMPWRIILGISLSLLVVALTRRVSQHSPK